MSNPDMIWEEFRRYEWITQPEEIWQFSRKRYQWAKDQWPNLSDRITTIWVLQELGLIPDEVDVTMVISVSPTSRRDLRKVEIHTHGPEENIPHDYPQSGVEIHPDVADSPIKGDDQPAEEPTPPEKE